MADKQEYREFKELLKKGIGKKTQREFAKDTRVSFEHINRMINHPLIFQPSKETLRKLSRGMSTVTLSELMEACGYPAVSVEDEVDCWEDMLSTGYAQLSDSQYDSPEAFFQTMCFLYLEEGTFSEPELEDSCDVEVDFYADSYYTRRDAKYVYSTKCRLACCETRKGRIIPVGFRLLQATQEQQDPEVQNIGCTVVRERKKQSVFDRSKDGKYLLEAILGEGEKEYRLITGYGLYGLPDWDSFVKFLADHAGSFCKTPERSDVFQKAMASVSEDDFAEKDEKWDTGDIVAAVMEEETGMPYKLYYHPKQSCIMVPMEIALKADDELMGTILSYARELGIEEFGACYFHSEITKRTDQIYKTENFRPV